MLKIPLMLERFARVSASRLSIQKHFSAWPRVLIYPNLPDI